MSHGTRASTTHKTESVSMSSATDVSVTNTTITEATDQAPTKGKSKRRKKKTKDNKLAVEEPVVEIYDEYEEDLEKIEAEVDIENESFGKRIQRLQELIKEGQIAAKTKKSEPEKDKKRASSASNVLLNETNRLIQSLKDEIEMEAYNTDVKIKIDKRHMIYRRVQLEKSLHVLSRHSKAFLERLISCSEEDKWNAYKSCNGLPDPTNLQELNRFLYIETLEDTKSNMSTLSQQCFHIISLIDMLNNIIKYPQDILTISLDDYKEIRQKYRNALQIFLDIASYNLLRQIDRDLVRVDLNNARYVQELTSVVCCFWALIKQPISMKFIADKDRKAIEVSFEEIELTIKMPVDINCYSSAIRVVWIKTDYYSDLSASFTIPELPTKYVINMDLLKFCQKEYSKISKMRNEQKESREQRLAQKRAMIERIINPPEALTKREKSKKKKKKAEPPPEIDLTADSILSNPEEIILRHEEEQMKERRRLLFKRCKKIEVNLRKYRILGGIFQIDLLSQPPQPKGFRRDIFLTTVMLPKELDFVKFSRPYIAPTPDPNRTPEVIEAELKALELAMEALVLVTLKLPATVSWFEPPLVAHWIPEENIWSTEDVHDIKYNEDKQIITFRTGKLGIHGLAGYRFVNLPFQNWELKPEPEKSGDNGVILSITGAIIQLEFLVREDMVSLQSVIGGGTALDTLVGNFIKLHELIEYLRSAGCDIFPEKDAGTYLRGLATKHPLAVTHLQHCMSLMCTAYTFSWSRWNATRCTREIVVQIKEVHGCIAKDRSNSLILVTPFQTSVLRCSEISSEFSTESTNETNEFYADAYTFALHNAGIKSLEAIKNISSNLCITVGKLLDATNFISMSS